MLIFTHPRDQNNISLYIFVLSITNIIRKKCHRSRLQASNELDTHHVFWYGFNSNSRIS